MRYTVAMTIEADDLADAWNKAFIAFPSDLTPDSIKEATDNGLLAFCLNGGGKEIRADFVQQALKIPGASFGGAIHRSPGDTYPPIAKRGFPE